MIRTFRNSSLLIGERSLRIVLATAINIYAARQFGPYAFGVLAFAQSLLVLVTVMGTLGLPEVALRDMSRHPAEREHIALGAYVARCAGSLLAVLVAAAIAVVSEGPSDPSIAIVLIVVAIYAPA